MTTGFVASRSETISIFDNATNTRIHGGTFTTYGAAQNIPQHDFANSTEISMENVANQTVQLHLHHHTEIYKYSKLERGQYRQTESQMLEDISEDEEPNNQYEADEERTSLSTAFSRTLESMDQMSDTRALRRAANTFAQLVTRKPFMEEESTMETEDEMSTGSRHRFISDNDSPWNQAVQGVVNSVNTMSRCATGIRDHSHTRTVPPGLTAPMLPSSEIFPLSPATQIPPYDHYHHLIANSSQAVVGGGLQAQIPHNGLITPQGKPRKSRWRVPLVQSLFARSRRSQPAPAHTVSPRPIQTDNESYTPTVDASEWALERELSSATMTATPAHLIQATKERMMTIHPLLMPSEDRLIPAHRLASLYFTAVLDPCDIPEFKAEYIYAEGRHSSILLTFKSVYDADRLKELWDSADRENTRAPELAKVMLYQGDTSAKPIDTSVRDAAFDELSSFRLTPSAVL